MPFKQSPRLLPLKMMLGALSLLTLSACGMTPIKPEIVPPGVPMLPPTRLSSITLKPAGKTLQLSDIERQKKYESEVCKNTEDKLIALQKWAESLNPPK